MSDIAWVSTAFSCFVWLISFFHFTINIYESHSTNMSRYSYLSIYLDLCNRLLKWSKILPLLASISFLVMQYCKVVLQEMESISLPLDSAFGQMTSLR